MKSSLLINQDDIFITKTGTVVFVASIVLENNHFNETQTIFYKEKQVSKKESEDSGLDDHSKYEECKKLIGIY